MKALELVQHHLQSCAEIRLEWSLELTKDFCRARDQFLVWIVFEDSEERRKASDRISQFLSELCCPTEVINKMSSGLTNLSACGIRLTESEVLGEKCIYLIPKKTTGIVKIEAFKWKSSTNFTKIEYDTQHYSRFDQSKVIVKLHESLQVIGRQLCELPIFQQNSAYSFQYLEGEIQEVYLTFATRPTVCSVIDSLPEEWLVSLKELIEDHGHLHFKHIGLSSKKNKSPRITIYFNGPLADAWPQSFSDLRECVAVSAKQMHENSLIGLA